jgi:intein-encoded DNA endonuclease-like protein
MEYDSCLKKRNYEYALNLYKNCQHFCKKINNHFYEEDLINIENKTYFKKKTF